MGEGGGEWGRGERIEANEGMGRHGRGQRGHVERGTGVVDGRGIESGVGRDGKKGFGKREKGRSGARADRD